MHSILGLTDFYGGLRERHFDLQAAAFVRERPDNNVGAFDEAHRTKQVFQDLDDTLCLVGWKSGACESSEAVAKVKVEATR